MLARGLNPNLASPSGWSLLHVAARRGKVTILEQLLAAGANPSLPNSDRQRPADIADTGTREILMDRRHGIVTPRPWPVVGDQV